MVGDLEYERAGDEKAQAFGKRGLFLCANRVTLEHPFYNSELGRPIWDGLLDDNYAKYANGTVWLHNDHDKVMMTIAIDVPARFNSFLNNEERRYNKFQSNLEGASAHDLG